MNTQEQMNLQKISDSDLSLRLEKLVRTERKITHLILWHILEFETRKLYAELGYDRMYSYLTKHLGYSESCAYSRLQAARLLKKVPDVAQKLEDGTLNLTQMTQVQKCIRNEQSKGEEVSSYQALEILSKIENKNSFETKKVLAVEFNEPIKDYEVTRPQKNESVRIEVTLTKEQFAELEMARSFLSHQSSDNSWAEVITLLAKKLNKSKVGKDLTAEKNLKAQDFSARSLKKSDQLVEDKRIEIIKIETAIDSFDLKNDISLQTRRGISTQSLTATANQRVYLSVKTKRELLRKANYCCQYKNAKTGKTCSSQHQLEIDHIYPLAWGGKNSVDNLRVLCRAHNQFMAHKYSLLKTS